MRIRFSAVAPEWRVHGPARLCYLAAFDLARRGGYPRVTLGNDPNLYGHVPKVGLFYFKSRMGFTPVPGGTADPAMAGDDADLILRLERLSDPVVLLGHTRTEAGGRLVSRVIGSATPADRERYTAPSVTDVVFTPLAGEPRAAARDARGAP